MCFLYNIQGDCFERCIWYVDHLKRDHSVEEQERALDFLKKVVAQALN